MTTTSLVELLCKHGNCSQKGNILHTEAAQQLTFYVNVGAEAMTIGGIESVEIDDTLLIAKTQKEDVFILACEDVRALRIGKEKEKHRTGLIR